MVQHDVISNMEREEFICEALLAFVRAQVPEWTQCLEALSIVTRSRDVSSPQITSVVSRLVTLCLDMTRPQAKSRRCRDTTAPMIKK